MANKLFNKSDFVKKRELLGEVKRTQKCLTPNEENSDLRLKYMKKWQTEFSKRGTQVVFLVAPVIDRVPCFSKEFAKEGINIIDFSDPLKHPDLFVVEERFDSHHLLAKGARRYSRKVANRIHEMLLREVASQ
jgi:hypothetical protein